MTNLYYSPQQYMESLKMLENISQQVGTYLPSILAALAVLVIGWLVAHFAAKLVRMGLVKSGLDRRLSSLVSTDASIDVANILSKIVFYLLMIFVVVTFFNVLNLPVVSEPLNAFLEKIFAFAPRIISAAVLGIVAYVLARFLKFFSKQGLEKINIDNRVASLGKDASAVISTARDAVDEGLQIKGDDSESAEPSDSSASTDADSIKLSQTIPEAIYWIVFALFLPAILGALEMPGLLEPVQAMFTKALDYVPNIFGAAIIMVIGLFVAKIIRQVVSNLTASLGVNALANRVGMGDALSDRKISDILGVVVYALVLLPVVVAALNTLDIDAVTQPASAVLAKISSLFPGFLGAAIVLSIAFFVGKIVSEVVEDLLSGVGFDKVPEKLGFRLVNTEGNRSPSKLGGKLVLVAILLLSVLQALPMMGLDNLAEHVDTFVAFGTRVLLGLGILALGMFLANLAAMLIKDSGIVNSDKLGMVARFAIIIFAGGFALEQIGLAPSIINVAFGALLGGIGLAMAIAFGWGGQDAAKRVLDRYVK